MSLSICHPGISSGSAWINYSLHFCLTCNALADAGRVVGDEINVQATRKISTDSQMRNISSKVRNLHYKGANNGVKVNLRWHWLRVKPQNFSYIFPKSVLIKPQISKKWLEICRFYCHLPLLFFNCATFLFLDLVCRTTSFLCKFPLENFAPEISNQMLQTLLA